MTDTNVSSGTTTECECCCIGSQNITFNSCEDIKDFTIQNLELKCEGRFLKIRVELKNVCRGRKVNVGVLVCENESGTFFTRAFKACQFTVPSGTGNCTNVTVDEFCFVFPDENICNSRTFVVKVIAHYGDFPSFPFCPC
ncbi:hypothetical protein ABG79_01025 [Caloramator mitchellensis]|uniref:Uncharacterized protein n=1 Tax=Caloramator mitchellensis TaxID=908809 RepID=A0A0R3JUH0_CALMK|nr:hypothetical protein [Caloramator mitchellensis]KRQ87222.1 hypothetical protein ABG79_01025 [Caloramator mitchellensis]